MKRHVALVGALASSLLMVAFLFFANAVKGQTGLWPSLRGAPGELSATAPSGYVGSDACAGCHDGEIKAWRGSHHALAMAVAGPETVSGDFSGVVVEAVAGKARFFKDGDAYRVETEGRTGSLEIFTIGHTFGWEPLQQYLVAFPDGRLQALPWAWDTRPKAMGGQRWFHVYGAEVIPPSDTRHWTRLQQNWNHMCAECHSTGLDKGYEAATNSFKTTFSEISVGCEGCHGAGGSHLRWARATPRATDPKKGFSAVAAKRSPSGWTIDPATGSPPAGVARPIGDEVETCARCHSRRGQISSDWAPGRPLGDTHLPSFLTQDLFEDDGQMRDEVFNDHSFKQSLMFAKGVTCGDCHDPHSGRLKANGADVCSQCHLPEKFSAPSHTGHSQPKGAPDCISCHMPARDYMVVDRRHDHSFRIPRPDISVSLGTPNACTDCHKDRPAQWAADAVARWHGPARKGYQRYAAAFHASRSGDASARDLLIAVVRDPASPAYARATAVLGLSSWRSSATDMPLRDALTDPDPLVRVAALRNLEASPADLRWERGSPALSDPVRIVRLAAAYLLADQANVVRPEADKPRLEAAFDEFEASQRLNADRPESLAELGLFRQRQGRFADAEAAYRAALELEPGAATISVNLADLFRIQGRENATEETLRAAINLTPDSAIARHALGLSLIRQKRYPDAMSQLARAVDLEPASARYSYVYGIALQSTGKQAEATQVFRRALVYNPADANMLSVLFQNALRSGNFDEAAPLAERLTLLRPDDRELARLVERLKSGR